MKTTDTKEIEVDSGTREKGGGAGIILAILSVLFLLCTGVARGSQFNLPPPSPQTFTTLSNFPFSDVEPEGGLVADSSGNLFGTTFYGAVFELPCSGTPCTYPSTPKLLYSPYSETGIGIASGGLTIGSRGDLYATGVGGNVWELPCSGTPCTYPSLKWLYTLPGSHGFRPLSTLVVDSAGNLYGTATQGVSSGTVCNSIGAFGWLDYGNGCGYVFKLSPPTGSGTQYTLSVLHDFTGADGYAPVGGLVLDPSTGTLYGTTMFGGSGLSGGSLGYGTVFKVSTSGTGFQVLHSFSGLDGANPIASLVMDSSGNLYGTTMYGGQQVGAGTVFELSPDPTSATGYSERALYTFDVAHGMFPGSSLVMDSLGNLYGTTYIGGGYEEGTVFKIDPSSDTVTLLHNFEYGSNTVIRAWPRYMLMAVPQSISAGLATGPLGNLYGTTYFGGLSSCLQGMGCGTAFEVTNPAGEAEALITQVNALLTAQVINQGQDGSLVGELQHAIQMIDANKLHGAVGNLESFITEVDDLENSGVLSSGQAAPLVNIANAVIEQLQAAS